MKALGWAAVQRKNHIYMKLMSEFDKQCFLVARYIERHFETMRKGGDGTGSLGLYIAGLNASRINLAKASFRSDLPQVLDELKRKGVISFYEDVSESHTYAKYGAGGVVADTETEWVDEFHVGLPDDFQHACRMFLEGSKVVVHISAQFHITLEDASTGGYTPKGIKQQQLLRLLKSNELMRLSELARLLGQTDSNALHTIDQLNDTFKKRLGLDANLVVDDGDGSYGMNHAVYCIMFKDADL